MTALALTGHESYWTDDQLAVLEATGIERDVTHAELQTFLHLCQRTGLDPFARQIYLIGRYDNRAGRKVYRAQTGIDGLRLVAQRTCLRHGETLSYEDTLWCGEDGKWVDVWLSRDKPSAAKVTVLRNGHRFPAVATMAEYGLTTGLWPSKPALMLAKCAEALALRKAFPQDLSGVYTAEEMGGEHDAAERTLVSVAAQEVSPLTEDEVVDLAVRVMAAKSVEELRDLWNEAGPRGALDREWPHPDTAELISIRDLVMRRTAEIAEPEEG